MDKRILKGMNKVLKNVKTYNTIGFTVTGIMLIATAIIGFNYFTIINNTKEIPFEFFWVLFPVIVTYFMYQGFMLYSKSKYPFFQFNTNYIGKMIQFYKNGEVSNTDKEMEIAIGIYDFSDRDEDAQNILKRSMVKIVTSNNYDAEERLRKRTTELKEFVNKK